MTSRREFLQIGLAATALPLITDDSGATAAASHGADVVPLYKILYDVRFPASVAFARRAAEQGVAVKAMEGDMTRFWYDDLYHRWQQGPAAIAGLTSYGALFCLERLAWDQRMRVVFRAEHRLATAGCVAHSFAAPAALVAPARAALAAPTWAAAMGDLVTRCPNGRNEIATAEVVTTAGGLLPPVTEALYSWVIAPAIRV